MALNHVIIMGNLTRDVELRYTPGGTAVGSASLAINRTWKDSSGQQQEEVSFIDVTLWGRTAEVTSEYAKKGSRIIIQGRLKQEQWTDKESGAKRSKVVVVAENMQLCDRKGDGQRSGTGSTKRTESTGDSEAERFYDSPKDGELTTKDMDDIPF